LSLIKEHDKNEVKRNIGAGMKNFIAQTNIKRIIKLSPYVRNDQETETLVNYLKKDSWLS